MNYLHFTQLQRALAFLILHGHTAAHIYRGRIILNAWNSDLTDALEISLHPGDVKHFANEFTLIYGAKVHTGNFAPILDASEYATAEALDAAGLIIKTS
jgi:hypothetical protein